MNMLLKFPVVPALAFISASVFFIACTKENNNYHSRFTLLNAVPNSKGYTIKVGDNTLDSSLPYGEPLYNIQAPAATTLMQWKSNLSTGFDSSLLTDIPNGSEYTLLFFDSLGKYQSYLVQDQWEQPSSKTQGYVRFFPMIINGDSLTLTNDTGKILIGSQSFGNFLSGATFYPVDTLHNTLRLFNKRTLIDSIPSAEILPGKSYTIYAIGVLNQTGDKRPRMIWHEHE
jgi:hypothetical protein